MGLSFALALITWVFTAKWQNPVVPVLMAVIICLMFLYCRAIYRGRSWARWLLLIGTALGLWVAPQTLAHFNSQLEQIRYVVQAVLQVLAIVLLFLPESNRWCQTQSSW